eukprot:6476635-Amphidinium_carterae.2
MVVAPQEDPRVHANVLGKLTGVRIIEPHAVDNMPTGVRRDHRTDVPISNVSHVVLHNASYQTLKGNIVKVDTMTVVVGMTPDVIRQDAMASTPWTRGECGLRHVIDA